jgi:nucleoside-diphosphate-sugar epimerase
MRVFVTGASGFIGSAVVQELIRAGHQVLGLARSENAGKSMTAAGAEVRRGDLEDMVSLRNAAAESDGVIHTAFVHDFSKFKENCEIDRRAIEALGSALVGSKRRLVVACGITVVTPGRLRTEEDASVPSSVIPRAASEEAVNAVAALGVGTALVRLPPVVHDRDKQGLVTMLIAKARETGSSVYVGDGANRWPAVHRLDAAHLFRLVFENGTLGSRYHAVAEEGIPLREIATVIGGRLNVPVVGKSPEEATKHFGWLGQMVGLDSATSSAQTQKRLGWRPTQIDLVADLEQARI